MRRHEDRNCYACFQSDCDCECDVCKKAQEERKEELWKILEEANITQENIENLNANSK